MGVTRRSLLRGPATAQRAARFSQEHPAIRVVEFNVQSVTLPPWQSAQQQPAWQRFAREQPWVRPFIKED